MSAWRTIVQVDAFTTMPCTGNPAAVVPDAADLDPVQMQRLAREMNLSETAFVLPSERADFRLRWWTPMVEMPLCGHATIGACHALAELGRLQVPGAYRIETAVGVLDVTIEPASDALCRVWMDTPIPEWQPSPVQPAAVLSALRTEESLLMAHPPIVQGGDYVYVPFSKVAALISLKPDWSALELLSRTHQVSGFVCWSLETLSPESSLHVRFFAPAVGINEDPVTGSAQGPLGALVAGLGLIKPQAGEREVRYRAEQGDAMGRAGRVDVVVTLDEAHEPVRTQIGGVAVTVLRGEVRI